MQMPNELLTNLLKAMARSFYLIPLCRTRAARAHRSPRTRAVEGYRTPGRWREFHVSRHARSVLDCASPLALLKTAKIIIL
jgi:hypothetical protein